MLELQPFLEAIRLFSPNVTCNMLWHASECLNTRELSHCELYGACTADAVKRIKLEIALILHISFVIRSSSFKPSTVRMVTS